MMRKANTDLLFSILQDELFGAKLTDEQKEEAKLNIPELMKLSKYHDLSHLVADALIRYGLVPKEEELFKKLEKEKLTAIFRSVKMERELAAMKDVLTEAKIVHTPLKGSVIRALYPESYMRTSCDIDLLIKEDDLDAAIEVLTKKLNYKTDGMKQLHDVSLYSPSGVHLELHFCILEGSEKLDRVLSQAWKFASPEKEGSYTYLFSTEFLIFHVLAHAAFHMTWGGTGIRPFIDFKLMYEKLSYDENLLLDLCAEAHILRFKEVTDVILSVWFGNGEHNELSYKTEQYILSGGVYGTDDSHAAARQVIEGGKLKRVFSLIFMPYKNLIRIYPSLEGRRYLTPIYQVRRWFRIIFKGRLRKGMKILKSNVTVSKDSITDAKELFDELEIG